MSREAENTLLLLIGLATAMITFGGAFTRYVKPSMSPWLLVTAAFVIGLAVVAIAVDVRRGSATESGHALGTGHAGHSHQSSVAWLLVIPVIVLIFVTPPALRPQAATPTVTEVSTDVLRRPFPALPAGRAPEVSVPDVMTRSAQDTAGTLDNRLITVVGFTLIEDDGVDLGRVMIICCAADARLTRIHLRGPRASELGDYPDETWLRVEGTVLPDADDGNSTAIPTMEVAVATPIDAPEIPYA